MLVHYPGRRGRSTTTEGAHMRELTRREWTGGIIAALTVAAAGCATMSPTEEREAGRDAAEEVRRTMGLLPDSPQVEYVRQVGARLAQAAQRGDITWQFNVADDQEANAFALPGGFVYVTRGSLALLNSEDELAGILGHELAHVLERHAGRQARAATPFAVLFGVPAAALGVVSPTLGGIVAGTGRLASSAVLAPYSRDQEREADARGIALAARAGWEPGALGVFLHTLEGEERLGGRDPNRVSFLSTHPSTPERVDHIRATAGAQTRVAAARIAEGRAAFVSRLEGVVIGDNP